MIAERYDAAQRTVAVVLWRLLQITPLLPLAVWIDCRNATKGTL